MLRGLMIACLLAALGSGLSAQQDPTSSKGKKKPPRSVSTKTESIRGLSWHGSLEGAIAANAKSRKKRPILHLRMLGDLRGKT